MTKAPSDPYQLSPDAVREPPDTLALAVRQIGPGLILAGSIVGTGELIQTTDLGARTGFSLLWLVFASCCVKVFVQIELGRFAVSSGETTLAGFARVPGVGRLLCWWWLGMMLTTQTQIGAMIGGVGQAFHTALPGVSGWVAQLFAPLHPELGALLDRRPELPWALLTTVVTVVLLLRGSYRLVEYLTTLLVVAFTIMTVGCLAMLPWTEYAFGPRELASGLTFHIPPGALMYAFAMLGITGVGASELIAYPYWCIEKGYARNVGPHEETAGWVERARGWLRVMQLDAWLSLVIYTTATLAFYLLGAAVLHGTTGQGLPAKIGEMLTVLAGMYEPVLGPRGAMAFIVIGAFAVLYSTLFAATAANSRTTTDFLRVQRFVHLSGPEDRRRWVRRFCVAFPLLGLALYLFIDNPLLMVTIGGIAQAITLPLIGSVAIYLRARHTDRRLTSGAVWDVFLWLSLLALAVAASYGLWQQVGRFLK